MLAVNSIPHMKRRNGEQKLSNEGIRRSLLENPSSATIATRHAIGAKTLFEVVPARIIFAEILW